MSDRDPNACGLCGNSEQNAEYTGTNGRGCPSCGGDLSPVVGSKHLNGHEVITHNGRPHSFVGDVHADSAVVPHPSGVGYVGLIRPAYRSEELIKAEGKTRSEAARNATAAAAAHMGRQFKVRDKETEKRIKNFEY